MKFLGMEFGRREAPPQVHQEGEVKFDITKQPLSYLFGEFKHMDRSSNMRSGHNPTPEMIKEELIKRMGMFPLEQTRMEKYADHGLDATDIQALEQWIYDHNKNRKN